MQTTLPPVRLLKKFLSGSHALLFMHGLLLGLLTWMYVESNYESELFRSLATHVKQTSTSTSGNTQDSLIIRSLHLTHQLEKNRSILFGSSKVNSVKAQVLKPLSVDLMIAQEACGGFSYVLGRLLQELDTDIRFAQMKVNGMYGGHILIEAKLSYGWVVLDPLYDLYFTRPDCKFASFADVQNNWDHYSQQLPAGYDMAYRYDGVRYTNWDKIPMVMPAIKNVLSWNMGKEAAENYSIRNFFLRKFDLIFYSMLAFYALLLGVTARRFFLHRKRMQQSGPELLFPKTTAVPQQVPCSPVVFSSNL